MTLEKPTPRLFQANLNHFEEAIGWVRRLLLDRGYRVTRAVLDPYVEVWFFYEHDDTLVLLLGHSDIERITEGLYRHSIYKPDSYWRLDNKPRHKNGRILS